VMLRPRPAAKPTLNPWQDIYKLASALIVMLNVSPTGQQWVERAG